MEEAIWYEERRYRGGQRIIWGRPEEMKEDTEGERDYGGSVRGYARNKVYRRPESK